MSECIKLKNFKYSFRNSPPYPANKCKTMKKKGNDSKLYLSQSDKNGTYKWYNVNKSVNKRVSKNNASNKDLQILAKKYSVTKSGTNRELAERLVRVKGFVIKNKRDRKIIEQFLKIQTHHAKVYGFEPANT